MRLGLKSQTQGDGDKQTNQQVNHSIEILDVASASNKTRKMSAEDRLSSSNKKSSTGNVSLNLKNYNKRGKLTIDNVRENSVENVSDQVRYFNDNKNFSHLFGKVWNMPHKQSKGGSDGGANQTNQESMKQLFEVEQGHIESKDANPFSKMQAKEALLDQFKEENLEEKDKRAFVLEIDNINDFEMLESMWDDPIINHSKQKIKTDILLINTHMNLISEDHLIEHLGKKKHQLFKSNMPPEIGGDNDKG